MMLQRCWLAWLLLIGSTQALAEVRAWLDRETVTLGETVTLNIELQGVSGAQPDLTPLDADFERVGVSSSSQISIVNGARTASRLFAVALSPRREGLLPIPPLSIGQQTTAPLVLKVTTAPVAVTPGGDVFIETEVDTTQPYVQQQVDYVVRLFFGVTVLDGQLDDPAPEHVRVLRLGNDKSWQVERGNRRYSVVERRFALVPERSGPVSIAAPVFRGRGMDRNGMGGMFGGGVPLNARGEAIEMDVRAAPAGAATPWLPAQQLTLEWVDIPTPGSEIKVGEPLTIGLRLSAVGLGADQLPDIDLPSLTGATVYPDQDSSRDSTDGGKLVSERVRRFAIVPQQAGSLRVTAPQLAWWDVGADVARRTTASTLELQVVAAAAGAGAVDVPAAGPVEPPESAAGSAAHADPGNPWRTLALLFALAWVLTLVWVKWRPVSAAIPSTTAEAAVVRTPSLAQALRTGTLREIARALRSDAPQTHGGSLSAVATALQEPAQAEAVLRLERHLYAPGSDDEDSLLQAMRAVFARGARWRGPTTAGDHAGPLPPLYG